MRAFIFLAFLILSLNAREFVVGYRQSSAKHAILNENLTIAEAMIAVKSPRIKSSFAFEIAPNERDLSLAKLLKNHQDELLENLFKNGVLLSDEANLRRNGVDSKSVLTLPSARIGAFVKEDMVTIVVYEDSDR
jgi:hypothetical protein